MPLRSLLQRSPLAMIRFILPLLLIVCLGECRPTQDSTTVVTGLGRIVGFEVSFSPNHLSNHSASGRVFLGIPYVHPPTGERRFKRPQPILKYGNDPLKADEPKPSCPQWARREELKMDEDCLYLNVMTPSTSSSPDLYPVMVYIHGGGLEAGTATDMESEGVIRNLVRHGVIVVTIQYRLGALGFFNTRNEDFPPNLGMLDQMEALRWVQSQIVFFGGDPTRVTLFGHSAGAASISAHTYSPLSKGLFHAVILLSGSVLTCLDGAFASTDPSRSFAESVCNFTSAQWNSGDFSPLKACLHSLKNPHETSFSQNNFVGWKMVVDGYFLPAMPQKLASSRHNVPVLIGSMQDEFEYFLTYMEKLGLLKGLANGSELLPRVANMLFGRAQYESILPLLMSVNSNALSNDLMIARKGTSDMFTGGAFIAPIQKDIRDWMENGNFHIFIYEITHPSRTMGHNAIGDWDAAIHSGELLYFSANSQKWKKAMDNNWTIPYDFQLMEWMGEAFTSFAISGIPDSSWTPVSPLASRLPYLEISSWGRRMKSDYRSSDELTWTMLWNKAREGLAELPK